jgi:hypothetical protein
VEPSEVPFFKETGVKFIRQILTVLLLVCATQAYAEPEAGRDYTVFSPAMATHTGNKIEVIEFFF